MRLVCMCEWLSNVCWFLFYTSRRRGKYEVTSTRITNNCNDLLCRARTCAIESKTRPESSQLESKQTTWLRYIGTLQRGKATSRRNGYLYRRRKQRPGTQQQHYTHNKRLPTDWLIQNALHLATHNQKRERFVLILVIISTKQRIQMGGGVVLPANDRCSTVGIGCLHQQIVFQPNQTQKTTRIRNTKLILDP